MKYLVPYDFTPIARTALDHALSIGKSIDGEVELLHIIAEEDERIIAEDRFADLLSSLPADARSKVKTNVAKGDIYTDIAKEAEEKNYDMLVMGTHGPKGLQKLFGSRAIKVITSSHTPFIVTQTKGPAPSTELIVMPVDLSKESVQVVRFAGDIAKRFDAAIHIVGKPEKDEYLRHALNNNITNAKNYLQKHGVRYEVHELEGKHSLEEEVINYGEMHGADLFAVAHFSESILPQFDLFSQHMITNRLEIPVLILNASEVGEISNWAFLSMWS